MTTITIETQGSRHYVRGDTYPLKDQLRAAGCRWDPEARAWWSGKREVAERFAAQAPADAGASTAASAPERQAPGLGATVAGRATYKGRTYYVAGRVDRGRTHYDDSVCAVSSRDGSRVLLYSRDGSLQFWAALSEVTVERTYQRPTTIQRLRDYAAQRRAEDRGEAECPVCAQHCTCGHGFCHHHHDGCGRCGAEAP